MRTCIVFRGENLRHKRGLTSALECLDNWKETILDVIDCDVAFFTYPSEILDELIEKMSPVHVCTSGYDSQDTNVLAAVNWMIQNYDQYDRFVLLRFDFTYRRRITEWHQWNNKGIILVNKDVHYPSIKLYADMVFIMDREYLHQFKSACVAEGRFKIGLHHIGGYLEEMPKVPLHVMYHGYYHMVKHPLHALHPWEPRPNLNDTYQGEEILDVLPWNPSMNNKPTDNLLQNKKQAKKHVLEIDKKRTRPFVIFNTKNK